MKIIARISLLILCSVIAITARAEVTPYVGADYLFLNVDTPFSDADLGVVYGRAGVELSDFIALEVRLGTGVADDDIDVPFVGAIDVELTYLYGFYFVSSWANETIVTPYILLGYTEAELEFDGVAEDDSDISFGFGLDVEINESLSFNAEYSSYYDADNVELTGLALGLSYSF